MVQNNFLRVDRVSGQEQMVLVPAWVDEVTKMDALLQIIMNGGTSVVIDLSEYAYAARNIQGKEQFPKCYVSYEVIVQIMRILWPFCCHPHRYDMPFRYHISAIDSSSVRNYLSARCSIFRLLSARVKSDGQNCFSSLDSSDSNRSLWTGNPSNQQTDLLIWFAVGCQKYLPLSLNLGGQFFKDQSRKGRCIRLWIFVSFTEMAAEWSGYRRRLVGYKLPVLRNYWVFSPAMRSMQGQILHRSVSFARTHIQTAAMCLVASDHHETLKLVMTRGCGVRVQTNMDNLYTGALDPLKNSLRSVCWHCFAGFIILSR